MSLKIKVCGMREELNLAQLIELHPDFVGFIFYPKSKRFVGEGFDIQVLDNFPSTILKVGVFVNEPLESLLQKQKQFKFNYVQLHGDESSEMCERVKQKGIKVIKAFSVDDHFDFNTTQPYEHFCEYFLFDTKGEGYGGHGSTFNWEVLEKYKGKLPFLLSGGLDNENIKGLSEIKHEKLFAIDVNSKYEIEPGLKNIDKLRKLFSWVRKNGN